MNKEDSSKWHHLNINTLRAFPSELNFNHRFLPEKIARRILINFSVSFSSISARAIVELSREKIDSVEPWRSFSSRDVFCRGSFITKPSGIRTLRTESPHAKFRSSSSDPSSFIISFRLFTQCRINLFTVLENIEWDATSPCVERWKRRNSNRAAFRWNIFERETNYVKSRLRVFEFGIEEISMRKESLARNDRQVAGQGNPTNYFVGGQWNQAVLHAS